MLVTCACACAAAAPGVVALVQPGSGAPLDVADGVAPPSVDALAATGVAMKPSEERLASTLAASAWFIVVVSVGSV